MKNTCCLHWYVKHILVASQLVPLKTYSTRNHLEIAEFYFCYVIIHNKYILFGGAA